MNVKRIIFILSFTLLLGSLSGKDLVPGTNKVGTKEDTKLITSIGIWYMEIRNTVRDAYNMIQYTKQMIANLEMMNDWYERNVDRWQQIGTNINKMVSEPARWDEKLLEIEGVFDQIDHQLFDETSNLDYLLWATERSYAGMTQSAIDLSEPSFPQTEAMLKEIKALYGGDPSNVVMSDDFIKLYGAAVAQIASDNEAMKIRQRDQFTSQWQKKRLVDASLINTSMSLAKTASIKRMQYNRTKKYVELLNKLNKYEADMLGKNPDDPKQSQKIGTNFLNLRECLNTLYDTNNEHDYAVLSLVEMELYFNQLGLAVYDATSEIATKQTLLDGNYKLYSHISGLLPR